MTTTALILASGQGSRMRSLYEELKLPKHLLPLANGETIIGRLIRSLSTQCDEILCTIRSDEDLEKFEEALLPIYPNLKIVVRENTEHEFSELSQVSKLIKTDNVVQTNGDLIFPDGVVESFVKRNKHRNHFYRGREANRQNMTSIFDVLNSRISILPTSQLALFSYSNKLYVSKEIFLSMLLGRVECVPTLFNVDTPEDYQEAQRFFSEK